MKEELKFWMRGFGLGLGVGEQFSCNVVVGRKGKSSLKVKRAGFYMDLMLDRDESQIMSEREKMWSNTDPFTFGISTF